MKVKLISYSKPTEEIADIGIDDAQELVAFCARVSNPSNQLNPWRRAMCCMFSIIWNMTLCFSPSDEHHRPSNASLAG